MRSRRMLPLLILLGAGAVVVLLALIARKPGERLEQALAPLVRVEIARPTEHRFTVVAHGSVTPRTESELVPQVSGEVLWMSTSFVTGGFFEADEVLARVDPADYRVELESARAVMARAESEWRRAEKELDRQRRLADRSVASQSRIDDAENAYRVAEASRREAEARLERARRDLARTELRAPYRGRVRDVRVDVGQFVNRGSAIATLYAVDYAEVRLPVPDRELAYLDVPLVPRAEEGGLEVDPADDAPADAGPADAAVPDPEVRVPDTAPRVALSAEFAGRVHRWQGRLVRTEAELDPRSRMVQLVVRVADPYGLRAERGAPLAVGLFVEAEIEGRTLESAYVLPRDALREGGDRVYVVDAEDRIRFREVEVLRTERDRIVVGGGLSPGDRVCTSPLDAALDGMEVRVVVAEDAPSLAGASGPGASPRPAVADAATGAAGSAAEPAP